MVIIKKWTDFLLPGLCVDTALSYTALTQLDGVRNVWSSRTVEHPGLPRSAPPPGNTTSSGTVVSRQEAAGPGTRPPGLRPLYPRQTAQNSTYQAENYSDALHRMTGVTQLHRENITGAGVTVAVVDDGVYYNHELVRAPSGTLFATVYGCLHVRGIKLVRRWLWTGFQSQGRLGLCQQRQRSGAEPRPVRRHGTWHACGGYHRGEERVVPRRGA